jgi:hypothetical protein
MYFSSSAETVFAEKRPTFATRAENMDRIFKYLNPNMGFSVCGALQRKGSLDAF